VIFAGGVFSWLVMMPAIKFFGSLVPTPIYPSTIPIGQMTSDQLWQYYIRYIGAGAVAAAGLITLVKTTPTIVAALRAGAADLRKADTKAAAAAGGRTSQDLPMTLVLAGSAIIVAVMWAFLTFKPVPGAPTGALANVIASVLVVVFGFLFVTVSSRIAGLIGTSSNPISGMAIATLMATCALFLVAGWTAPAYGALALTIGGTVCIAAANAGNTSQDLKTGFLVGATPSAQQKGLFLGVLASCFAIGITLIMMNKALEKFVPASIAVDVAHPPDGVNVEGTMEHNGQSYTCSTSSGPPPSPRASTSRTPPPDRSSCSGSRASAARTRPRRRPASCRSSSTGSSTASCPGASVLLGVFPGHRGRAAGDPLAELRGRLVPFDRHDGRDLLRWHRALAGRAQRQDEDGRRGKPGRALCQRPHRRGRDRGAPCRSA
jgi:hypothetical protein